MGYDPDQPRDEDGQWSPFPEMGTPSFSKGFVEKPVNRKDLQRKLKVNHNKNQTEQGRRPKTGYRFKP